MNPSPTIIGSPISTKIKWIQILGGIQIRNTVFFSPVLDLKFMRNLRQDPNLKWIQMGSGSGTPVYAPGFVTLTKGSRKKRYFFSGPATKALPPPSSLVATEFFQNFFLELKKRSFFLVTGPLKKHRFCNTVFSSFLLS